MQQNTLQQLITLIKQNKRSRAWQKIVRAMACVVVFCTTYALILPAITMTAPANCGLEEHTHSKDCYVQTVTTLVCEAAESDADVLLHTHASICYDAGGSLICTLPEIIAHTHSEDCYEIPETIPAETEAAEAETTPAETVPAETVVAEVHTHSTDCYEIQQGDLICQTPAETYHTHEDTCYGPSTEPSCGLAEAEAHTHGDSCYESVSTLTCTVSESEGHAHGETCQDADGNLICEIPESEGHAHSDSCYSAESKLCCQKSEGEGHSHTDTCFGTVLTCTIPEVTVHEHTGDCYEQLQNLICGLEEGAVITAASEPATVTLSASSVAANTVLSETVPAEPVLVCTKEELYLHTHTESCGECSLPEVISHEHTEACFRTDTVTDESYTAPLTCTLAESEEHTHDFRCYGSWNLVCEIEEHTHNEQCASDPNADLETAADWEATFANVEFTGNWAQDVLLIADTQLGYTESEKNFTFFEDDPTLPRGYTRYGQWYGVPYGDWCGMFVSFCLDYAGVEEVPLNFGCRPWIEELSSEEIDLYRLAEEYTPNPGDIVFFDWDGDKLSDHVGLVYELIQPTEEELAENASAPIKVKTIEGNSSNRVQYKTYTLGEACLLGYGDITAAQENYNLKREVRHTAEVVGEDFTVTVRYSDMAGIPEGAVLVAEEILPGDERYQSFMEQVEAETASEEDAAPVEITYFRALDVHFALGDQEIPLNAEVQVSVTFTEAEQEELNVAHFADDGTMDQPESTTELGETGDSTVSFNTDSFSGIVFYNVATADADTTPLLIDFGENTDTVGWNHGGKLQSVGTPQKTTDNGLSVYTGKVEYNASHSYMRFFLNSGSSYTVKSGDVATVRLKMTGVTGNLGTLRPCLQANENNAAGENEVASEFMLDTSGGYVTYTLDLSALAGCTYKFFDVKWYNPSSGASGTYYIDYIRIGQPEHTHSYTPGDVTLSATCGSIGSVTYTCECGDSYEVDTSEAVQQVLSYAIDLKNDNVRGENAETDYSQGFFGWDTEGKPTTWHYYNGVMLDAFMRLGTEDMRTYVMDFYADNLRANGSTVNPYTAGEVDSVPMALALFDLLGSGSETENAQYEAAIHYVYSQLESQYTLDNVGGNFQHKMDNPSWATYPFALDGLYMANTFLMEYANALEAGTIKNSKASYATIYDEVFERFHWVATNMRDTGSEDSTGLYHHGWNPETGKGNGHFWGRAIGWYAVALVDVIDMMPEDSNKETLKGHLKTLFDSMLPYQDSTTGMWYNVVNRKGELVGTIDSKYEEGSKSNTNILETSVSSMMAYAMIKAYREDWVDKVYGAAGLKALEGIVEKKMVEGENGIEVQDTYLSSGVKTSDEAYLSSPYRTNEAKGVGPLIMAAVTDHEWGEWTVTKAATTTATGVATRTCSVCKTTQTAEIPKLPIGWKFQTVDPMNLEHGETYAIYTKSGDNTYTFMFSDSKSFTPKSVTDAALGYLPITISTDGTTWTVTSEQLGATDMNKFTWFVEEIDGYTYLGLQGYGLGYTDGWAGSEYLMLSNSIGTYYYPEGKENIKLTIQDVDTSDTVGDAASKVVNTNKSNVELAYSSTATAWQSVASGSGTNVYFAKVTPVYETQAEEEVYNLKVLGSEVTADKNKKYVIYVPEAGNTNVKFLGSTVKTNSQNNRYGSDAVEEDRTKLITSDQTWTLESSKMSGFSLKDIEWTVVEKDGTLCLQSVADENLYLYLDCTNPDNGKSPAMSFAYDEDYPEYHSLDFEHSGNASDSYYKITSADGAYGLHLDASNAWSAIIPDFVKVNEETQLEDDPLTVTHVYIAEVIEDTTEDDEPEEDTTNVVGYNFTTLNPNNLEEGQIVTLYYQNADDDPYTDTYTFALSNNMIDPKTVSDTGFDSAPVTINGHWDMTTTQMGDSMDAFTWKVHINDDDSIMLESMSYTSSYGDGKEYLCITGDQDVQTWYDNNGNVDNRVEVVNGAGFMLYSSSNKNYMAYTEDGTRWTCAEDDGVILYFASVEPQYASVSEENNHPHAVHTGNPTVNTLRFYNFVEDGEGGISDLTGCVFRIEGIDADNSGFVREITSDSSPELHLPSGIPEGNYRITEVSVPEHYMRDADPVREFTVAIDEFGNRTFSEGNSIGTFINHATDQVEAKKVGEVEDYNNRIYQIMLSAESDLRMYDMDPVDVIFVVDQSNSMLFPAGLEDTNLKVSLNYNAGFTDYENQVKNPYNSNQLDEYLDAGLLETDTVYYIIADATATSTVYAIWHNGSDWMYQDASYYAKAKHNNAEGYQQADGELAVFPTDKPFSEQPNGNGDDHTRANGGSLSYELGNSTLGKEIRATKKETQTEGENTVIVDVGTENEYAIYTATNDYNRLHYLQDALAHAIHQLADANPLNTVTLMRFNRVTQHSQCEEKKVLNSENVDYLINQVNSINTGGGTRQDIALHHVFDHLMGNEVTYINHDATVKTDADGNPVTEDLPENIYTKGPEGTYTVLITDGAPVLSGDDKNYINLGTADDTYSGTETEIIDWKTNEAKDATAKEAIGFTVYGRIKYYADRVKKKSTLMTVGLGMDDVVGGKQVLEAIASEPKSTNHMIIDDAEQLMNALKNLLFAGMAPREKVDLMGDITDEISDSFYPIAWIADGSTVPDGHQLLELNEHDELDTTKDWIILEPGDWITADGEYAGKNVIKVEGENTYTEYEPCETSNGKVGTGQLCFGVDDPETPETEPYSGSYYIKWTDQMLYDCELVWVPLEEGKTVAECLPNNKALVAVDDAGRIWFSLEENDQVYAHGEYVNPQNSKTIGSTVPYDFVDDGTTYQIAGIYKQKEGESRLHIDWTDIDGDGDIDRDYYDIDFDASFQPYLWYGKFYVKAKEDFIGGNAIDTNKSAQVSMEENDAEVLYDNDENPIDETINTVTLETPTVNVRLLELNDHSSEVTVFLGDSVENALPILKDYYSDTWFTKLIDEDFPVKTDGNGEVTVDYNLIMNAVDPKKDQTLNDDKTISADTDGLLLDKFYLRYSMVQDLTDEQWDTLVNGGEVRVEYTYDSDSSQGKPVGYFTLTLSKPENADFTNPTHEATTACQPGGSPTTENCKTAAETYTLQITYTAYKLGETAQNGTTQMRPLKNANNGTGGPGTEVGGKEAGATVETGLGSVDGANVHEAHVISGAIEVTKVIDESLVSDQDQTFTFTLHRMEDTDTSNDQTISVTVLANSTTATCTVPNLERGTWVLTEDPNDNYLVQALSIKDTTNCYGTALAADLIQNAIFHIGYNVENEDVIGTAEGDAYTSYLDPKTQTYPESPIGVFGAAQVTNTKAIYEGKVPVQKVWVDSKENNKAPVNTVYVILTQKADNEGRVTVTSGDSVKILALSGSNDWRGEFTVSLLDSTDTVAAHEYGVVEVEQVITEPEYNSLEASNKQELWTKAVLEGSGQTVYYKLSDLGNLLVLGEHGYTVTYSTVTDESDDTVTQVVTNTRAYELPEAGGAGTTSYTLGGLLLISLAVCLFLVYNDKSRREDMASS